MLQWKELRDLIDTNRVTESDARMILLELTQNSSSLAIQHNQQSHDFEVSYESFKHFVEQLNAKVVEEEKIEEETLNELMENYREANGNSVSDLLEFLLMLLYFFCVLMQRRH